MPVQYRSIVAEHRAVRERAGLFDVSHMGQLHLHGEGARASVARLVTARMRRLASGAVRYACLCREDGGVVDDVTVYQLADDAFFLCVNAANIDKDRDWVARHTAPGTKLEDRSDATALLALQGPESAAILAALGAAAAADLGRFRFAELAPAGLPTLVSRTGYTGSDGFELYLAAGDGAALWDALLEAGAERGLEPAGLGARDTLRLEAALPLYGHELDDATSPLEARLDRFVDLARDDWIGALAVRRRRDAGHARLLVGFEVEGRGIARAGYPLKSEGREVGRVTSGAPSPTLGRSIGLGYVPPALADVGTALAVEIRGKDVAVRVCETPFVSKP